MIMARYCLFTWRCISVNFKTCQSRLAVKHHFAYLHTYLLLKTNKSIPETETEDGSSVDFEKQNHANLKIKLLDASLYFVPKYGWSKTALANGAQSLGLSVASHTLINEGGADLVHYFNYMCNRRLDALLRNSISGKKYNLQIYLKNALEERLKMVIPYASKWSEAMALMMFPTQMPNDSKNLLELVDIIWHYSRDKSLDMTWYSKRLSTAALFKACELSLVQDQSPDFSDTLSFLERYIEIIIEGSKYSDEFNEKGKRVTEFGAGALITVRNLLGVNRWLR